MDTTLPLRVRSVARPEGADDARLVSDLVDEVRAAVSRRGAAPVVVVVRDRSMDLLPVAPILQRGWNLPGFLAGLTRTDTLAGGSAIAVGLAGRAVRRGRGGEKAQVATVFVEWSDCSWWHWQALLDTDGASLRDGTEVVRDAREGDALPAGLGRWWTLGRRHRPTVTMSPSIPPPADDIVH